MKKKKHSLPDFGSESIGKILLRLAPPVMLAQLIQALYNIVDSFFVGMYSDSALTALSVVYPLQLIMIALAVGTGVGVNTYMARAYARADKEDAEAAAGTGLLLALLSYAVFVLLALPLMRTYAATSTTVPETLEHAVTYGSIVSLGSIGVFLEGCFSKIHQARGNMRRPMAAQILGALVNIVLDPLLIFGIGPIPAMGVAGAALATVIGQIASAVTVAFGAVHRPPLGKRLFYYIRRIYFFGYSSILMQSLFTVYILALNIILAAFSDAAVTVLGLYYKLQSFFFIPLMGLQTCIVPVLSYNYEAGKHARCRETVRISILFSLFLMLIGVVAFVLFPDPLIGIFSQNASVHEIGRVAFPIIGSGFLSAVFALFTPTYFQAIGAGGRSAFLAVFRQLVCLIPLFYLFSRIGLNAAWIAFPVSETLSGLLGMLLYIGEIRRQSAAEKSDRLSA